MHIVLKAHTIDTAEQMLTSLPFDIHYKSVLLGGKNMLKLLSMVASYVIQIQQIEIKWGKTLECSFNNTRINALK